ncbi:acidic repeat-containing protein-like isoform X2 [Biomphalaria pfeifferi]|uniref:Acidic repeat-containing protein-like isoform X2 n=1 Tax=Biomphalaria pfeifferi TaxID=112525 RepID=A0AAD8B527_BIOPF|nr:acidic repeat-containing protein-like isoform X2 [Biomphalaria pfeifferi]
MSQRITSKKEEEEEDIKHDLHAHTKNRPGLSDSSTGEMKLKLEDVPDVEFITENNQHLQSRLKVCPKEKYHKDFISIADFETDPWRFLENKFKAIDDLPDFLKYMSALTGQIIVERDGRRVVGSGFIHKIRRGTPTYCPCHVCLEKQETKKQVYGILTVTTVIHNFVKKLAEAIKTRVFSENWDSKNTKVRLFYDEENEENKTFIYSYKLLETDKEIDIQSDWCSVECVTHDMKLVQELEAKLDKYMELQGEIYRKSKELSLNDLVIIIGHPHGGPKMISVGKNISIEVLKEVRSYQKWCRYEYDNMTCHGSSGSPVFILGQPLCGFGYWFGHPHNHSKGLHEKAKGGCSSVGVEDVVI